MRRSIPYLATFSGDLDEPVFKSTPAESTGVIMPGGEMAATTQPGKLVLQPANNGVVMGPNPFGPINQDIEKEKEEKENKRRILGTALMAGVALIFFTMN